jgi:hypothetical protein
VTSHGAENDSVVRRAAYQRRDPAAMAHYRQQIRELHERAARGSHLLVADEFYFVAHHPITFKPRLAEPTLLLGLSAALLGEQLLFGAINIRNDQVILKPPAEDNFHLAYLDDLAREVYGLLGRQRHITSVHAWLEILSTRSYERVVDRLTREGRVTATKQRRGFRKVVAYPPTDPLRAGAGVSRIAGQLSRQQRLEPDDAVLIGLMDAVSLRKYVLDETVPDKEPIVQVRLDKFPTREVPPALEELFNALKTAADRTVVIGLA